MKPLRCALLASSVFLTGASPALAQGVPFGQVPQRPTVSPFINLNRAGTSTGINYYGLVRPQEQAYGAIGTLQLELAANQAAIATGFGTAATYIPTTGVSAGFMTQSRYFMTRGSRSTGNRAGTGVMTQAVATPAAAVAPTQTTLPLFP